MKGREKNEYIWRGKRRGGLSGITEFGKEKKGGRKGDGRGKRVKWGLIMKETELGSKKRQRMAKRETK